MQCCGGGTAGDADKNVERSIFAVGDVFETVEDGGALEGDVSSNDIGENLLFAVAANSTISNGDLTFNSDGTFIYIPNPDFHGSDSIVYEATDSVTGESDSATLTIIVENDFEFIEEYGWELVWSDEFNGDDLSDLLWTNQNASVSGGNLIVGFVNGMDENGYNLKKYIPYLGSYKDLRSVIKSNNIEEVLIAIEQSEQHQILEDIINDLEVLINGSE